MNNKIGYLVHYGVGPDDNPPGRGSGRYPKGSGKNPRQSERTKNRKRLIQKDDINLDQFKNHIDELQSLGIKIDSNKNLYLPKGMVIQRTSFGDDKDSNRRIYTSFLEYDKGTYASNFIEYEQDPSNPKDVYIKEYVLKRDIKVMNNLTAIDLVNKNKDKRITEILKKNDISNATDKEEEILGDIFEKFDIDMKKNGPLLKEISKRYDGTIDIFDSGIYGSWASLPLIILNPKETLQLISNKKIYDKNEGVV